MDRIAAESDEQKRLCLPRSPTARPDRVQTNQGDYVIPPMDGLEYRDLNLLEKAGSAHRTLLAQTDAGVQGWQVKASGPGLIRPKVA